MVGQELGAADPCAALLCRERKAHSLCHRRLFTSSCQLFFWLSQKVGVVRTDGANNCVAAGGVLGDVSRQRVDADQIRDFPAVGGSSVAAAGAALDLGNAVGTEGPLAADGVGRGQLRRESDVLAEIGGGGIGHAIASQLGTGGAGSRRGDAAGSIAIESQGSAGSQAGPSGADGSGVALVCAAGRDCAESDDEGGDGDDLPDLGSDCGDTVPKRAAANLQVPVRLETRQLPHNPAPMHFSLRC